MKDYRRGRSWREDLKDYTAPKVFEEKAATAESPDILMQRLGDSVQEAWIAWQASLSRARKLARRTPCTVCASPLKFYDTALSCFAMSAPSS